LHLSSSGNSSALKMACIVILFCSHIDTCSLTFNFGNISCLFKYI
jgi:hypothetical protein